MASRNPDMGNKSLGNICMSHFEKDRIVAYREIMKKIMGLRNSPALK